MAISFIGSGGNSTSNTATIPTGTAVGDKIIVFALQDNGTTIPSLASGYTSLTTGASTALAFRLAIKTATSGDTVGSSVGTWTNATGVMVAVYRGLDSNITNFAVSTGNSSTPSFSALTLNVNNTSWVLGLIGVEQNPSNLSTAVPSGMALRSSGTAGQVGQLAIYDTTGGVTAWAPDRTTSLSVSTQWITVTAEMPQAPKPFAFSVIESTAHSIQLSKLFAADTTPKFGSATSQKTAATRTTWTSPSSTLVSDSAYASWTGASSTNRSGALIISGFDFGVFPSSATITGMAITVLAKTTSGASIALLANPTSDISSVTITDATDVTGYYFGTIPGGGGGLQGFGPWASTTPASFTAGSSTTMGNWGGTWAPSDFTTSFGVVVQKFGSGTGTIQVDSVSVTVYFDAPSQKTLAVTVTQTASVSTTLKRTRAVPFSRTSAQTQSVAIKRGRSLPFTFAEFLNYAAGVSKSSSGPTSTGATNPTTSSGTGWTGTANIYAQDGSNATITPVTTGSAPLKAQGFGFTIPAGATINGISFDAYAYQAGGTSGTIDVEVRALKADGSASSSSASTTSINTTASYKTYGSSSSLWGETWTYTDINDVDFGVQIIPTAVSGGGGGTTISGYTNGSSASSTSTSLGSWSNPSRALVGDSNFAAIDTNTSTPSSNPYLTVSGYGFSIPTGATILAVEVSIGCFYSTSFGQPAVFETVQLLKVGTATGSNKGSTSTTLPTSLAYVVYGDTTSDLWGDTWAPSDINDVDFGVTIRPAVTSTGSSTTVRVDDIRVRVTYATASSPDRVFTVDHVRATVNYTPVDQTAKLVTFSLAETGGTSFGSFTRGRNVPFTSSESTALTAAVKRNRTVSTTVTQLYDIVLDIIRARNVPVSITIAEVEQILNNLQVTRAPVTATQSPTAVSEGTGTYGWTNTSNVFVQDGAVAYIDPHTADNKPLRVTNFGYSLVPGVTVLGVKFEAYAYQSGGTVGTVDVQAKLIKADGTTTTASETISAINTVPSYKTYGSSSSLWGTTLTGADINDVDFGIEITPIGVAGGGPTSTGLVNPGSVSQVTGNLSRSWTNITNVLAADGSYTSLQTDLAPGDSTFIVPSNFGLSIPAGSTIDGIEVTVTAYSTTTGSGNVLFDTVQLTSAGSPIGTGQSSNEIVHASTATATTFGGAANTWGATLTDTVVNSSTFGVRVRFKDDGQFTTENVFVDSIQLKVYYTQTAIPPDRRLNVDHVRAIVTYTPIDLKSLGAIVVSYLEAMSAASNRSRRVVPTITEVETATAAVKRARLASFAVPETMTLTTALSRLKQVAITLAESVGHTFTASRLRQLQQQSITELETFSFGSLRRIRNVITSLQETTTTVANVIRTRALPLTVAEQEAITEAIGLARKLAVTLNEQLVVTPQLSRKKQIAAAIAEVETLSATYIKVKFMVAAINYVESVATTNIIRTRALAPLIAEVEADVVAVGRSRKISTVIPQTETVQSTLARFRKALVSVLEQESIAPITTARLRGVIAQLHEQEQFDVALSIILASASPEVIGVTMTWYEQEVKIDGTVNYKLMSETWNVKRSADIVTVDIAVPAAQIINI